VVVPSQNSEQNKKQRLYWVQNEGEQNKKQRLYWAQSDDKQNKKQRSHNYMITHWSGLAQQLTQIHYRSLFWLGTTTHTNT
jgi:hypothetical protein